ncbi:hypothetical protein [Actinobaculum sp. 352]|uniref:WXG100 family type VII secretion target n=2 Tax=Actinobaculum sp. 352 TaxID=2490946 RepID=UPI000F7D9A66|nr:hypothetical protein [Actinobaculum sp. 352]RTE47682.1 hypothetical protein EKN07_12250 [Actinobaculum sp. 352]
MAGFTFEVPQDTSGACYVAANRFGRAGNEVNATQVGAASSSGVAGWAGEAADAYMDQIEGLHSKTMTLYDVLLDAATALRSYGDAVLEAIADVGRVQSDYDAAKETYERELGLVEAKQTELNSNPETAYSQAAVDAMRERCESEWEAEQSGLQERYRGVLEVLDEAASTAMTALAAAQDKIVDPKMPSGSRDEVALNVFGDLPYVSGEAAWDLAQTDAHRMSKYILDEKVTAEEVAEFNEKYGDKLSDPFVANALMQYVTPEDLVKFSVRAGVVRDVDDEVLDDVLRGTGAAVVLGSGGMNLEGGNAERQALLEIVRPGLKNYSGQTLDEQTDAFLQAMEKTGRTAFNTQDISSRSLFTKPVDGYTVMSQLMGEAGRDNPNLALGPAFFEATSGEGLSVAEDIVLWDSQTLTWATHSGYSDTVSLFGLDKSMCDPLHALYTLMDRPEAFDADSATPVLADLEEGRLRVVQSFLVSDTPEGMDVNHDGVVDAKDEPKNMTRYLTGGRVSGEYCGFQDEGEQFGQVIQQATFKEPGLDRDVVGDEAWEARRQLNRDATEIATQFMCGYQDGMDAHAGDYVDGQNEFGHNNSALRSWSGVILAPHVQGIALALKFPGGELNGAQVFGDDFVVAFDEKTLTKLHGANGMLRDLGFDTPVRNDNGTPNDLTDDYWEGGRAPAIDNLIVASGMCYDEQLDAAFSGEGNNLPSAVVDRWTPMFETLFTAPEDANDQQEAVYKELNARWNGLLEKGLGAIPFGPLIKSEWVEYFIDQGKANGVAPVLDSFLSDDKGEDGEKAEAVSGAQGFMRERLYRSMIAHGSFDDVAKTPAEYHTDNPLEEEEIFFNLEDGSILSFDEMEPEQREAFRAYFRWLGTETGDYYAAVDSIQSSMATADYQHDNNYAKTGEDRDN